MALEVRGDHDHMGAHEKKKDSRIRSKHWLEAGTAWLGMVLAGLLVLSPRRLTLEMTSGGGAGRA
jgi:hypothetical protein